MAVVDDLSDAIPAHLLCVFSDYTTSTSATCLRYADEYADDHFYQILLSSSSNESSYRLEQKAETVDEDPDDLFTLFTIRSNCIVNIDITLHRFRRS